MTPEATAEAVRELAEGGIDFIKDDELQGDGPHNPLAARIAAVMKVLEAQAASSGRKVMYAFNITGGSDQMRRGHDRVLAAAGTCVMVSLNAIGLAGADHLHVNGLGNKFCEDDASVTASARGCLTPLFAPPAKTCVVMPVFSSGQAAAPAADTYAAPGSTDLIYCCGGGMVAHPDRVAGVPLDDRARRHPELAQAPTAFGAGAGGPGAGGA